MAAPKKWPEFLLVAVVGLMIGYGTGSVLTERKKMVTLEHSVALKWSDGIFDDPPLGAHVFLEPYMAKGIRGKSVRLRVYLGREKPDFYMPGPNGEIDVVKTPEEAATKWSQIRWTKKGLHLGGDANGSTKFIPRDQIRSISR